MSAHNLIAALNSATASSGGKVIQILEAKPANGTAGFAPGCLIIVTAGADAGAYINTNTLASCTLSEIPSA